MQTHGRKLFLNIRINSFVAVHERWTAIDGRVKPFRLETVANGYSK